MAAPSAAPTATQTATAAQPAATTLPVTGTLANGTAFTGALSNLSVKNVADVPTLVGTVTGTGLPAAGTAFTAPIQSVATGGNCTILTLDLGPLNLNLLGLVVNLNAIHLNITAQSDSGNLLGNLLCAVSHLLDGNGGLSGLTGLLNRLLTGLGL